MARTLADAIEQAKGTQLDIAIGLLRVRPKPPVADVEIEMAFSGFDSGNLDRMARQLAAVGRQPYQDAEDAVQDGLLQLLERRPDLFTQDPGTWMNLLYETARYRLLTIKGNRRPIASIEKLVAEAGDAPFENARPCVAATHTEDQNAKLLPRPAVGFVWTREEIVGSIVRFRDYFSRPPMTNDFKAVHGLPSPTTVARHFGSVSEAILAAGMTPANAGVRRQPYTEEETVSKCLGFRDKEGRWPDWTDAKREPGRVPSASALKRFFGGTRACDIQRGVEEFLG